MRGTERSARLRRDGASLVVSVVLHALAALLIAPWLLMRSIPVAQIEVEVMLEAAEPHNHPERAARVPQSATRPPPPATIPQDVAEILPVPEEPGQGQAGRSAATPRETAGLSAPQDRARRAAPAMASGGPATLAHGDPDSGSVAPQAASLGSTPQASAHPMALAARPGEDRDEGPLTLEGPASPVQSLQPEFRHAARTGGEASLRGGGRSPDESLVRDGASAGQTVLLAARAMPQSAPGGGAASPGAAMTSTAAPPPVGAAEPVRETGGGSATLAAAALTGRGGGAAAAGAPLLPGGGRASTGLGRGSRSVSPGETATALAGTTSTSGTGSALLGVGPGAATSAEGRAQRFAGRGNTSPRETGVPRLIASADGAAATTEGGGARIAQLSARSEDGAAVQPMHEARTGALQTQQPKGEARIIEERFTAPALKVASPRSVCELPLLFAGFDRKPIPRDLDTIEVAEPMPGETPPRHHPGNQAPRYPLQALGLRAEGRVLVRAEVLENGAVGQLWIKQTSGFQILDLAALETVRGWHFHPAQRHGMTVTMWMDVPIEYKLP